MPTFKPRETRRHFNIGVLWKRIDKHGDDYYYGKIEIDGVERNIVVFKNKFKVSPTEPVFVIREDSIREQLPESKQYKWEE